MPLELNKNMSNISDSGIIVGASGSSSTTTIIVGASGSGSTTATILGRSISVHITATQGDIDRFFPSMGRRHVVDIVGIDPLTFSDQSSKQTRIDNAYTKEKKK